MQSNIQHVDEFINFIRSYEGKGNIYVVGAGEYGKQIGKLLTDNRIEWNGFVDGYLKELYETETGKMIYSYSASFTEEDCFIISSKVYADKMEQQLKRAHIQEGNILKFSNIVDIIWECPAVIDDWRGYLQKVQKFHNLYQGQKCFIIGNGPSLAIEDLEKLKNEVTFACNSIYGLYSRTEWRPTFWCAWDDVFCESILKERKNVKYLLSNCDAAFTSANKNTRLLRSDVDFSNLFFVRARWKSDEKSGLSLFSDDCSSYCYASGTVTYLMLQLAVYMGFHEIYLLGIDMSYSAKFLEDGTVDYSNSYAEGIKQKEAELEQEIDKICIYANEKMHEKAYMAAHQYADSHGIKIYNATRGGELEVFERVELDGMLKICE